MFAIFVLVSVLTTGEELRGRSVATYDSMEACQAAIPDFDKKLKEQIDSKLDAGTKYTVKEECKLRDNEL